MHRAMEQYIDPRIFLPFAKTTLSQIQVKIWKAAVCAENSVSIELEYDTPEAQLATVKDELASHHLNVDSAVMYYRSRPIHIIHGTFRRPVEVARPGTFNQEYVKALLRNCRMALELPPLEIKCARLLDKLYVDIQYAVNNDSKCVIINNPVDDFYDTPYSEAAYSLIKPILCKIRGLCFRIVEVSKFLWNEECIIVWNFPLADQSDYYTVELDKKDIPWSLSSLSDGDKLTTDGPVHLKL